MHRFVRSRAALACVLIVITAVFVATRLQYWAERPIPVYSPDSETYLAIAFDLSNGVPPLLDLRTPGYPLFLYAVIGGTDSVLWAILSQQVFTLLAAYVLSIASFLASRSLVLPSLVPSLGIVGSQEAQLYELWILPESIYAAFLVFVFASLLAGFARRSSAWLMLASSAMAGAILLRPAGLFLVGTYLLVLAATWFMGFHRGTILSFSAPLPVVLFALCSYNVATIGKFTVSPFGPANLAGATATFWREVPGFPESVNLAIRQSQGLVSSEDRETLRSAWQARRLKDVFHRYFTDFLWFRVVPALDSAGIKGVSDQAPYLARMSRVAISEDPILYLKFVYASLHALLGAVGRYESPDQAANYRTLYGEPRYLAEGVHPAFRSQLQYLERHDRFPRFRRFALREYETAPVGRAGLVAPTPPGASSAVPPQGVSFLSRVANRYDRVVHRVVYVGKGWIVFPVVLALGSGWVLLRVRRADTAALASLGLIVPVSLLGAVFLIALVEEGFDRYVYPTRFLFYLAPWLMAAIYSQVRSRRTPE